MHFTICANPPKKFILIITAERNSLNEKCKIPGLVFILSDWRGILEGYNALHLLPQTRNAAGLFNILSKQYALVEQLLVVMDQRVIY